MDKPKRPQQVFTLLVEIGRKTDDGLPKGATGAALMVFATGVHEDEAVRETVAVLKTAGLAPLEVSGYGTLDERLAEGHDIPEDERALMQRALDENAVIVESSSLMTYANRPSGRKAMCRGPAPGLTAANAGSRAVSFPRSAS